MAPNSFDQPVSTDSNVPSTSLSEPIIERVQELTLNDDQDVTSAARRLVANDGQGTAAGQRPKSFWDPNEEKAACGVGFIVNIQAQASNRVCIFGIYCFGFFLGTLLIFPLFLFIAPSKCPNHQ